jgi:monoamine oxidase
MKPTPQNLCRTLQASCKRLQDRREGNFMTNVTNDLEVIVVGAGAAGLAAAKRLAANKICLAVLEARDRIGGRALTRMAGGFPIDLGCGWLHSADRNPWSKIAAEAGFAIDKTVPVWAKQSLDLRFSDEDQVDFAAASRRFHDRLDAVDPNGEDFPAARLLEPGSRWNGLLNAISSYFNGAEWDRVSVRDFNRYSDSGVNWRVVNGYGAAIKAYGADLPVRLGCAVTRIDRRGPRIKVETSRGDLFADAVILTIPPTLIAAETIAFLPALPDKTSAAALLPLGLADKLVVAIDEPEFLPIDGRVFGDAYKTATASYHLRPFGRPLIEGYFGGRLARDLESGGPGSFFDFACRELVQLFGSAIAPRLRLLSETSWAADPWARGSYSYGRPGHSDARQKFAASVDGRLFFAGEACSPHNFSTAHGAYLSGIDAVEEFLTLRHRKPHRNAP